MKKICFIINNLGYGGAEKVFISDANKLNEEGVQVYVVLVYGNKDRSPLFESLKIPSSNILFLESKNIFDINSYLGLNNFIASNEIDILYATLNDAVFISRVVSIFRPKVKLFVREANTTEYKSKSHKISDVFLNWRAEGIIAVSEEVKRSILTYQSFYANKISVIYNGVDIPQEIHIPSEDNINILTVGSLTKKKSQKTLIEAFSRVMKKFPQSQLNIVGEGLLRDELIKQAEYLGILDSINFLGTKSSNELERLYKKASVFVLPSLQEGCPNVLLEAMSFAVPSIGTRVGAVPEIIEDGISGYIVPKSDVGALEHAIETVLASTDLQVAIGKSGRKKIELSFSNTMHLLRLRDILNI